MNSIDIAALLGSRSPDQIASYLQDIGDLEAASEFLRASAGGQSLLSSYKPYSKIGMVIGFIPPQAGRLVPIKGASEILPDTGLIGQNIKITLDKFYVADYPGLGKHTILCEFNGKNQTAVESEALSFTLKVEVADKSAAAISGLPIFMGLNVAPDGIYFKGKTVNVCNSMDDEIVQALDGPIFKNGLTLLHTVQPALKPLTALSTAIVKSVAEHKKNVPVHAFDLGLDFGSGNTSVRLRYGSYVVVQTDENQRWDWSMFEWSADGGAIQFKDDRNKVIDFNYMIFGVSPFSTGNI